MTATPLTGGVPAKLPLWRLILGLGALAAMATVLLSLAPLYLQNYRLQRALTEMSRERVFASATDTGMREQIVARAHELSLPVRPGDIAINRAGGKAVVQMRYAVDMNLTLYRVDLHFRPGVTVNQMP